MTKTTEYSKDSIDAMIEASQAAKVRRRPLRVTYAPLVKVDCHHSSCSSKSESKIPILLNRNMDSD